VPLCLLSAEIELELESRTGKTQAEIRHAGQRVPLGYPARVTGARRHVLSQGLYPEDFGPRCSVDAVWR